MKRYIHVACIALPCFVCGCASTSSHVLVGAQRPAIDQSQVRLYLHAPADHEEIAIVCADSQSSFARTAQKKMDAAIANLKMEAARLGANGIVLSNVGDQYGGAIGSGIAFGGASTTAGTTSMWTGSASTTPVFNKMVTGIAIYVPPK